MMHEVGNPKSGQMDWEDWFVKHKKGELCCNVDIPYIVFLVGGFTKWFT